MAVKEYAAAVFISLVATIVTFWITLGLVVFTIDNTVYGGLIVAVATSIMFFGMLYYIIMDIEKKK